MQIDTAKVERDIANSLFNNHSLVLDGNKVGDVTIGIEIYEITRYSGMYHAFSRKTGRHAVKVGGYLFGDDRPVTFKQKKDGTFNIDGIANKLAEMRTYTLARQERRANAEKNRKTADQRAKTLRKKFGMWEYSSTVSAAKHGDKLEVRLNNLTVAQATSILEAAKNAGIKLD